MSFRIVAAPPVSGTVSVTEVFRASGTAGPFVLINTFVGALPQDDQGRFVYDDYDGDVSKFYRVVFYDSMQVILSDTGPFSMNTIGSPDVSALVKLDHNVGQDGQFFADAMRYCSEGGVGLADVPIRVYRAADFDAFRTELALALTRTDDYGRWLAPVYVTPGMSYVVLFYKEGQYGPDVVRVDV